MTYLAFKVENELIFFQKKYVSIQMKCHTPRIFYNEFRLYSGVYII